MAIASGIAIDKVGNKFMATCEVINMTGGKGAKPKASIVSMKGDSLFDALRKMIKISGKKIYFGDSQVVIISNKIAKKCIIPALDFLSRDAEPRYTLNLMISKEKTARQILKKKAKEVDINSFELANMYHVCKGSFSGFACCEANTK
jgi:spore germination protein KC